MNTDKMGDETVYRYATTDDTIVTLFKEWLARRDAWDARVRALAKEHGRHPVVGYTIGLEFFAFTRKDGESADPAAWKDTPWVITREGYLRPRSGRREGKRLQQRMDEIGRLPHAAETLRGIPKMFGFLGRPELFLSHDEKTLVASYAESVKHDARWTRIKESDYWRMREERQASAQEASA